MNARKFAVVLGLFALCIVASAQNYNIRTSFDTNLRNTYSLQGNVVETVPSGTTLLVVGNQSRWLRISRNGVEVWMANWVRHTRVAGGEQTQSQPQSSSNTIAVSSIGYALPTRNGQTATLPIRTVNALRRHKHKHRQTSTQTTSTGPSLIDNCCLLIVNAIATNSGQAAILPIRMVNAARLHNCNHQRHHNQ